MKSFWISFFIISATICCSNGSQKLDKLVLSKDCNDIVEAAYLIGELRDTNYLPFLLTNLDDISTATNSHFVGISIYQSKIIALKKISGVLPPNPITYKPDSVNIKFYDSLFTSKISK